MPDTEAMVRKELLPDPIVVDLHKRVGRLEDKVSAAAEAEGRMATEVALIKRDVSYIRTGQDKITSGINKVLWSIAGTVLASATLWVISGNLIN